MDNIKSSIVSFFPIEKIRSDFERWVTLEGLEYDTPFVIHDIDTQEPLTITLSKDEKITMLRVNMHIDLFGNIHYYVTICLGNFIPYKENGIAGMEKGILRLNYNEDLSFYKGEIYYIGVYHYNFPERK